MKVDDLRKYRNNLEELEALERLLTNNTAPVCVQGSVSAPSFECIDKVYSGIIPSSENAERIARKKKLLEENKAIKKFIYAIPKKKIYDALFNYCLNTELEYPTWEEVAQEMGKPDGDALAKAVRRFLKNFNSVR